MVKVYKDYAIDANPLCYRIGIYVTKFEKKLDKEVSYISEAHYFTHLSDCFTDILEREQKRIVASDKENFLEVIKEIKEVKEDLKKILKESFETLEKFDTLKFDTLEKEIE